MNILNIFLPPLALALGVTESIYFFVLWLRHRKEDHEKAFLYWAAALFLFYWFQVPAILVGFDITITVTDFNLLFALTFPITFLSMVLIYLGILKIACIEISKRSKIIFAIWYVAAISFFVYYFLILQGIVHDYMLPVGGNAFFYIPIRIAIIIATLRLLYEKLGMEGVVFTLGIFVIISEQILGITSGVLGVEKILMYPPQAWYLTVADSKFMFITQAISVIMLVFAFNFLHTAYHRTDYGESKA